jgi:hypothetical protein
MKPSRRLAEHDIITRGVTVKIQQVAVRGNYENLSNDGKGEDVSRADRNPWLAKMRGYKQVLFSFFLGGM